MITALISLLITAVIIGLVVLGLIWVVENLFKCPIPLPFKQGIGIIGALVILLYALRIFGVA